jgi:hypothetical protein
MPGLGRKVFSAGEVLTAANVQGYLMDQSVGVFASSTARSSALGTAVSAGMVSYRSDDKALELYAGSAWQPVMASKNAIINGGMDYWQRGTSVSWASSTTGYLADRWFLWSLASTTTGTLSRQAFTAGSAPVAGYEAEYFQRVATTTISGASIHSLWNKIEDVRTFAGETVTMSFWARADSTRTFGLRYTQIFGSGGSTEVVGTIGVFNASSSWQRFSATFTYPSIAGKTIGAGSSANVLFDLPQANGSTFDIWGVQLESGSVATPFTRAGGTIEGELAACQRYYERVNWTKESLFSMFGTGIANNTTTGQIMMPMAVDKRIKPQSVDFAGPLELVGGGGTYAITSITLEPNLSNTRTAVLNAIVASGLTSQLFYYLRGNNSVNAFVGISAEL